MRLRICRLQITPKHPKYFQKYLNIKFPTVFYRLYDFLLCAELGPNVNLMGKKKDKHLVSFPNRSCFLEAVPGHISGAEFRSVEREEKSVSGRPSRCVGMSERSS